MSVYRLRSLLADESAATAIEYGLIAALIALAIVSTAGAVGSEVLGFFTQVETEVSAANNRAS